MPWCPEPPEKDNITKLGWLPTPPWQLFSGTTIKDTWTKPRGRVEAGEGGGFGWGGVEGGEKMQTTVTELH